MRLTTVLGSVDNSPQYYKFIPIQIFFWKKINVNFLCVFAGHQIPDELKPFEKNIILWNHNLDLKGAFLGQNLRMYYPALLNLPDDELVMITDMDIFPTNFNYFTDGLENFKKENFIYYRKVYQNQFFICYNAAHPHTWSRCLGIKNKKDIIKRLKETYPKKYSGKPGRSGWYSDQEILYKSLINYPNLIILNRKLNHLETKVYKKRLEKGETNFINQYTDIHFHQNYFKHEKLILDSIKQLNAIYP